MGYVALQSPNNSMPSYLDPLRGSLLSVLTIASTTVISFPWKSIAQGDTQVRFYCSLTQDVEKKPATFVTIRGIRGGEITLVVWSNLKNISAQKRCEVISQRFQEAWDRGNFNALGSGVNESGAGLICALRAKGQICDSKSMLFTLKNGRDSKDVIDRLQGRLRGTIGIPPIYQSSDGFGSIDMQDVVKTLSRSER